MVVNNVALQHLRRCVELARTALEAGHSPFGAVLVGADGRALHAVAPRTVVDGPAPELEEEMTALYEASYR